VNSKARIAIAGFIVALVVVLAAGKYYMNRASEKKVKELSSRLEPYMKLTYGKLSTSLLTKKICLSDVSVVPAGQPDEIKVSSIVVQGFDFKNKVPSFLHIKLNGIRPDWQKQKDAEYQKVIKELGYDDLKEDFEIDYRYNPVSKEFIFSRLSMNIDKAGRYELGFRLKNVDVDFNAPEKALMSFTAIEIVRAELRYEDDSLVPKLLKYFAQKENRSVDDFVKEKSEMFDQMISAQGGDKFSKEAAAAVKKFLKNPKKISISISPEKPVAVSQLMGTKDPQEAMKLLNLKVKN
jgi:hypothetical protein